MRRFAYKHGIPYTPTFHTSYTDFEVSKYLSYDSIVSKLNRLFGKTENWLESGKSDLDETDHVDFENIKQLFHLNLNYIPKPDGDVSD